MTEPGVVPRLRCLVGTITPGRGSVHDDVTQVVVDELRAAGFEVVRSVTINRERRFIEDLVSNSVTNNDADAVILIGGAGIGPRDYACEAIDGLAEHRIEGFGDAYRAVLREEQSPTATVTLTRASAGVHSRSVIVAIPRQTANLVRRAMQRCVAPMLPQAVALAAGAGPRQVLFEPAPQHP